MADVSEVAKYFIARNDDRQSGELITNMKLQKLLYYAQGLHLAIYDKPLFDASIVKWIHGPVVPDIYHKYKFNGSSGISLSEDDPLNMNAFSSEELEVMDEAYDVFGQFSAWRLREMTHEEPPWKNAQDNESITHQSLRDYFKTQLVSNPPDE